VPPVGGEAFGTPPGVPPVGGEPFASSPARPAGTGESFPQPPADRPGRREPADRSAPVPARGGRGRPAPAGTGARTASRRSAHRARRAARRRNIAVAVAVVSGLVVLPLVLWYALGPGDGTTTDADGQASETPGSTAGAPAPGPSRAGSGSPAQDTLRGRLRNAASRLCVGVVGGKAALGAETELTTCSQEPSQQWAYETDGLLRNGADPALCLDSHLGYSVRLSSCPHVSEPGGRDVRYDLTAQGAFVPRFDQDLALTPAATDGAGSLVLKTRANTATQRWAIDRSQPGLRLERVDWGGNGALPTAPPTPAAPPPATPRTTPSAPTSPSPRPTPTESYPPDACSPYGYPCQDGGQHRRDGWPGRGSGYGDGYGGR
ncbi:ricin-type beta-trefoil lectin domain protein, partial [Streptomyces sp. NPDC046831]|uniref:ricin-type beta-trefoil lectin domain protein n=1 Tax=Streptomyces sp. NPDC046831 TaxID=3154805 RepID=UPI00340F8969